MENSVIISSIGSRIDYYISAAGITNSVEKKEYKKKFKNLEKNITHPQILDVKRNLETFDLAMGEKRTTEKMYLERDIKYLSDIENNFKTSGRNFVVTMKQNLDEQDELEGEANSNSNSKTFVKASQNSNAYKIYSNSAS